jgi:predicted negative regulator of RcsB-dependent stress response
MKISKNLVISVVAILWVVFSLGYIGWDIWGDFKVNQVNNALRNGYSQAILDVGAQAAKCQEVPLNLGDNKTMSIVSVECLKQAQEANNASATPTPVKK